jgi:Ala-tRNA(Pro) deacylase
MPVAKLKEFLDQNRIKYVCITHSRAYTAQEVAASAHIPGKDLAKTVMVKMDGKMAMAVLAGPKKVDLDRLAAEARAHHIVLATEDEFKVLFPGCEPGAMPPFGNLYGMEVFVDESLSEDNEIAFNAGSHTELIRLSYADFERVVEPRVAKLTL